MARAPAAQGATQGHESAPLLFPSGSASVGAATILSGWLPPTSGTEGLTGVGAYRVQSAKF